MNERLLVEVNRVYHMGCGELIGWTTAPRNDLPSDSARVPPPCCMCGGRLFKGHVFAVSSGIKGK